MGPDGERLGLPYKKFAFYLMMDGAPESLKGFKEGGRKGEDVRERKEGEKERERERKFDRVRFRF